MSFDERTRSVEWMNPPPPGTVDDQYSNPDKEKYHPHDRYEPRDREIRHCSQSPKIVNDNNTNSIQRSRSRSGGRPIDRHPKHPRDRRRRSRSREYRRRRSRSRSGSWKRPSDKRYLHKSYRNKYSRSRSRSRSRRHRRRSDSRSRSPSLHKKRTSRSRSYSTGSDSDKDSYSRRHRMEVLKNQEYTRKVYSKRINEEVEEEEDSEPVQENTFKNDGSFLEMFKKMQEQQASEVKPEEAEASASEIKKPAPLFGKRRGGRVLKTGMVQKLKNPNELEEEPKDAWSVYMKEVRKYKEACCDDDSKTRPLVK